MTIQRNRRLFPFSRLVASTQESNQRRTEIEDTIAHLEQQLDDLVEQVNSALASESAFSDDTLLIELSNQVESIGTSLAEQISILNNLSAEVAGLPETDKILTSDNIPPLVLKHYFSGNVTIDSGSTGYIPDGFINDGNIIVNGFLKTL